jgi:hypothetical protein
MPRPQKLEQQRVQAACLHRNSNLPRATYQTRGFKMIGPRFSSEELEARLKFFAGFVLILVFGASMLTVVYSLVWVTQPMGSIAPADKQFFKLLETMTTFLAGSISTLVTTKIAGAAAAAFTPPPQQPKENENEPVQ